MDTFELLKQTFPISQIDRVCDGYKFIIDNTNDEIREVLGIKEKELKKTISLGEKYLYRVGKEKGKFKTMCISLSNFEIIRKKIFLFSDE